MFTTSFAAVALASLMASNTASSLSPWQTSYAKAAAMSAELKKPIAVFLAEGGQGKLLTGGTMSSEVSALLGEKFIPLHVDTTTDEGKKLAGSFNMTVGLVISDSVGEKQALRHTGTVSQETLHGYLTKYSVATTVVSTDYRTSTTVTATPNTVSPYGTPYVQPTQPVFNPYQNFGGMGGFQFNGSVGGCVGGNCRR